MNKPDHPGTWSIQYRERAGEWKGTWVAFVQNVSLAYAIKRLSAHLLFYGPDDPPMRLYENESGDTIPAELIV